MFGEQVGPGRASRAIAIVHIAIFDAVNSATGNRFQSYTNLPRAPLITSVDAAIAQAAHDTLCAMFPSQIPSMDQKLAEDLDDVPNGLAKNNGITVGRAAATAILTLRTNDGSEITEPRVNIDWPTSNNPGRWRQDPISLHPLALGAHWGEVRSVCCQLCKSVPNSSATIDEKSRIRSCVSRGEAVGRRRDRHTDSQNTTEQTIIGIYWAYDGTPSLCAPPRLYNQLATTIAERMGTNDVLDLARLFALINVAMADAGTTIWESKYFYDFWRPVGGIREADRGTGPTGRWRRKSAYDWGSYLFTTRSSGE